MSAFQIFTKNSNQWAAKPIRPGGGGQVPAGRRKTADSGVIAHTDYLINPASANEVTAVAIDRKPEAEI